MGATSEINTELLSFLNVQLKECIVAAGQEVLYNLAMHSLIIIEKADYDRIIGVF